MGTVVEQFMSVLEPCGLNLYGVVSATAYDQKAKPALRTSVLAPEAHSVIVFGSGGQRLWEAFLADLAVHPHHLTKEAHPLDAFVARSLRSASKQASGVSHRWFTPTDDAEICLDFRSLAVDAGLGVSSRLGLVIREDVGPWIGLRAACFVGEAIPTTPLKSNICAACAGPCEAACPGMAFTDGAWDFVKCADFHQADVRCAQGCDARLACPVGQESRYTALQRLYHYDRKAGRRALAEHLGIQGDEHVGIGPDWGGSVAKYSTDY